MKKGIFLLSAIIFSMFILQGCSSGMRNGMQSGYPAGHDMNPGTERDLDEPGNGGYS